VAGFSLFISDLHLTPGRPAANRVFRDFLGEVAPSADALYILGDLFEYWAGDDDLADAFNAGVAAALKTVAARIPVFFIHGNRDFLLLDGFARASGIGLLQEPHALDLYGVRTLLMHGDLLCTDDRRYQVFRRVARSRLVQSLLLSLPLSRRKQLLVGARRASQREIRHKPLQIMDVNPEAVMQILRRYGCTRLIHGHTHRPARHEHMVDGRRCERWVLSDWYARGSYLRVTLQGCEAVELPFAG
jgi:UDP-2,3-diacylglucosamine hydrolase